MSVVIVTLAELLEMCNRFGPVRVRRSQCALLLVLVFPAFFVLFYFLLRSGRIPQAG